MKTGNKGEWSELYVLFYVLAKGRMSVARGETAEAAPGAFIPVLEAYRQEPGATLTLTIKDDTVEIAADTGEQRIIERQLLNEESKALLGAIYGGQRSFSVPSSERLMGEMMIEQIKARSSDKTDIELKIHDFMTSLDSRCAFSIKSNLGNAPTLLNSSEATNFIYEVTGITDEQAAEINAIRTKNKILDRMKAIEDAGGTFTFYKTNNEMFEKNLKLIDSELPLYLSRLLYQHYKTGQKFCQTAAEEAAAADIMGYGEQYIYEYKLKQLLTAVALGMMPSVRWYGQDEANSGYIIVKEDGDVLAYYLYNRNDFASYLLKNTRFERGSTSRHKYMTLYKENGRMYIKLNLSIRFI